MVSSYHYFVLHKNLHKLASACTLSIEKNRSESTTSPGVNPLLRRYTTADELFVLGGLKHFNVFEIKNFWFIPVVFSACNGSRTVRCSLG